MALRPDEEVDDGYTRESFERAEEDRPEDMEPGEAKPTYLIVFKVPIETSDPNGDRVALGAASIEEALGIALMANPGLTYNDVLDHMEV